MSISQNPGESGRIDSQLRIDTRVLGRRAGSMVEICESVPAPERMGLDLIAVEPGTPMEIDVRLESVDEGVLVTGEVSGQASGQCTRCLNPVTAPYTVHLTDLYAYRGSAAAAAVGEDDDVRTLSGETVDLKGSIIDAIGVGLPVSPNCENLGVGPCRYDDVPPPDGVSGEVSKDATVDPRWAGLADLAETFGSGPNDDQRKRDAR